MRSGRTHFSQLMAIVLVAGLALSARTWAAEVTAFITDPSKANYSLVPSMPVKVESPAAGDTYLLADVKTGFQEMEGYGAAITDSTLIAMDQLPAPKRRALLDQLFHPRRGLNINYLRVPIGATDFGLSGYTYLDLPPGQVDPELGRFSFHRARKLVQFLKHVKRINPDLRVMLSPWSPPAWMKTSGRLNGGSLKPEYFAAYAKYLVKAIQSFESAGIPVDAITIQNEPFYSTEKYPSMFMGVNEQIMFIRDNFYPLIAGGGLRTKILALDHNYDLRAAANEMHAALGDRIAGTAYHCYGGTFDQMEGTTSSIYQTECSGGTWGNAPEAGTFHFWLQGQVIGAGLLGNKLGMGWNLALDQNHGPYIGHCTNCRGLVDIDVRTKKVTFNPELIAMAHAGKFLGRGARRIATAAAGDSGYSHIGYQNADGSIIYVVENSGQADRSFVVPASNGNFFRLLVPKGGAATVKVEAL